MNYLGLKQFIFAENYTSKLIDEGYELMRKERIKNEEKHGRKTLNRRPSRVSNMLFLLNSNSSV